MYFKVTVQLTAVTMTVFWKWCKMETVKSGRLIGSHMLIAD